MLNEPCFIESNCSSPPKSPQNSVLNTVLSFFQTLASKRLVPLDNLDLLFDCPLALFSSLSDFKGVSLEKDLLAKVSGVCDWNTEHEIFSFLNSHPKLLQSFMKDPKNNIFKGLLLYFLCHFYKRRGKMYQFHDKKSLVSCDLGLDCGEFLRLGVIILNGGFQFCPLKKISQ